MKKILLIIALIGTCFMVKAQFPSPCKDTLIRYINRFVRNSAVESFTNLRLNTALIGMINCLTGGGVSGTLDTAYKTGDTLYITTTAGDTIKIGGIGGGRFGIEDNTGIQDRNFNGQNFNMFLDSMASFEADAYDTTNHIRNDIAVSGNSAYLKSNDLTHNFSSIINVSPRYITINTNHSDTAVRIIVQAANSLNVSSPTRIAVWDSDTLKSSALSSIATTWNGLANTAHITGNTPITLATNFVSYDFAGTANVTWTMPSLASNPARHYNIKNNSAFNINLVRAGSDKFYTTALVDSFTIAPNEHVLLWDNAVYWTVNPYPTTGGSGATVIVDSTLIKDSLSSSLARLKVDPMRAKRVPFSGIGTIYSFGDSYTTDDPLAYDGRSYIRMFAKANGATLSNQAVSGRGFWKGADNANTAITPGSNNGAITVHLGLNDLRRSGDNAKTYQKIINGLRSIIANNLMDTIYYGNDAAITKVGTWTSASFSTLGGKSGKFSVNGTYSKTLNDTLKVNITGTDLLVGVIYGDGVNRTAGSIDVYSDNIKLNASTISLNNGTDGINDSGDPNIAQPGALLFRGLGNGYHAIKIVVKVADTVRIDYVASVKSTQTVAPVLIAQLPRLDVAGYATAPNSASNAIMAKGDSVIKATVNEYKDFPVTLVYTNSYWDTTGLRDHIHPDSLSHFKIFQAFQEKVLTATNNVAAAGSTGDVQIRSSTGIFTTPATSAFNWSTANSMLSVNGKLGINTAATGSTFQVLALAGTDAQFSMRDADLNHGINIFGTEVDAWYRMQPLSSTKGGAIHSGYSGDNATTPLTLRGVSGASSLNNTVPVISFIAEKKNGANTQTLAAGDLAFRFAVGTLGAETNLWRMYGNGDVTAAGTFTIAGGVNVGGKISINQAAPNDNLEINALTGTSPTVTITDADLNHGMNPFGFSSKASFKIQNLGSSSQGGSLITGASGAAGVSGLGLAGYVGATTTTVAAMPFYVGKKNGANIQSLANSEVAYEFNNNTVGANTVLMTIKGSGALNFRVAGIGLLSTLGANDVLIMDTTTGLVSRAKALSLGQNISNTNLTANAARTYDLAGFSQTFSNGSVFFTDAALYTSDPAYSNDLILVSLGKVKSMITDSLNANDTLKVATELGQTGTYYRLTPRASHDTAYFPTLKAGSNVTITKTGADSVITISSSGGAAGITGQGANPSGSLNKLTFWSTTSNVSNNSNLLGDTANNGIKILTPSLAVTPVLGSGLYMSNVTAAAAGAQQISGAVYLEGQGWKTNSTAASESVKSREYLLPVQGAADPTGTIVWGFSINGGAFSDQLALTSSGALGIGTTTPGSTLVVQSPTSVNSQVLINNTSATTTTSSIRLQANGANNIDIIHGGSTGPALGNNSIYIAQAGTVRWGINSAGEVIMGGTTDNGAFTFQNNSNSYFAGEANFGNTTDQGAFNVQVGGTGGLTVYGNKTIASSGVQTYLQAATYNDATTAASGTVSSWVINLIGAPTLTATNSNVTVTGIATLAVEPPIASTNTTFTDAYAFQTNSNGGAWLSGAVRYNVTSATDANYTVTSTDHIVNLIAITAGRNCVMPTATNGRSLVMHNKNTSGNNWTFTGTAVKDAAGNTITTLTNSTVYILHGDGTNWIKEN